MLDINKPMDIPEFNLQPPITGKVRLSADMQQTLALLCAMGSSKRIALKASETGLLLVGEPVIKDVVFVTGAIPDGGSYSLAQGSDIPCSSVIIMGHPYNGDKVWVRPYAACDDTHKWPLDAKEFVSYSVNNLNLLYFLFDQDGEKVIIAYTR